MKALIVLLLAGCAAGEPVETEDHWCRTHRCEIAGVLGLDVDAELIDTMGPAMNRWSEATGLDLHFDSTGTRVEYVDELWGPDMSDPLHPVWPEIAYCANTVVYTVGSKAEVRYIQINRSRPEDCQALTQLVLHELGHALDWVGTHTRDGVMAPAPYPNGLDDSSIELICSYAPCTKFQPERYLRPVE